MKYLMSEYGKIYIKRFSYLKFYSQDYISIVYEKKQNKQNAVKSGNCKNQPFKDDSICNVKVLYWSLKKYVKNRAVHIYFEKK